MRGLFRRLHGAQIRRARKRFRIRQAHLFDGETKPKPVRVPPKEKFGHRTYGITWAAARFLSVKTGVPIPAETYS